MTVLHTGSNNQYSERWQLIFGDKKKATKSAAKRTSKTRASKPVARAKSSKKAAGQRKSK